MAMVKVRLNQPRATDRGAEQIGDEIEVDEAEAKRMIAKGQCKIVEPQQTKSGNPQRQ